MIFELIEFYFFFRIDFWCSLRNNHVHFGHDYNVFHHCFSKGCKPDKFETHKSLKLSFTNIWGVRSKFIQCKSFLESNSPDILALYETILNDSIDSGNFSVRGYLHKTIQLMLEFLKAPLLVLHLSCYTLIPSWRCYL